MKLSKKVVQRVIIPVALVVLVLVVIIIVSLASNNSGTNGVDPTNIAVATDNNTEQPAVTQGQSLAGYYNDQYAMRLHNLYVFQETSSGDMVPYPLERPIFYLDSQEVATIEALFMGVSKEEALQKNLFSLIPASTALDVRVEFPILYIEADFATPLSNDMLPYVLYQVVSTGTQFDYVNSVHLMVNGKEVSFSYQSETYQAPFSASVIPILEEVLF